MGCCTIMHNSSSKVQMSGNIISLVNRPEKLIMKQLNGNFRIIVLLSQGKLISIFPF